MPLPKRDLHQKMSSKTVLMVALQKGHEKAVKLEIKRRVSQNPKSTLGWTDSQEEVWSAAVDCCRYGNVYYITCRGEATPEG